MAPKRISAVVRHTIRGHYGRRYTSRPTDYSANDMRVAARRWDALQRVRKASR